MHLPNPWTVLHDRHPNVLLVRASMADRGRYYRDIGSGVIVVRRGLLLVEERSVLWHELVHLDRRDYPTCDGVLDARQELRCEKEAARRAIPIDWLCAAARVSTSRRDAADMLKVTEELLSVRMRWLHPAERAAVHRADAERSEPAA